jgi:hypothetical protein
MRDDYTDDDLLTLELRVRKGEILDRDTALFLVQEVRGLNESLNAIEDQYEAGGEEGE